METPDLRHAYLRAFAAEDAGLWHLAAQSYLVCLEQAKDARAEGFFAAKLARAYGAMDMPHKAGFFALYAAHAKTGAS